MESKNGKEWTSEDIRFLRELADKNTPTRIIALKMGRTDNAIYSKAAELDDYCKSYK